jgi:hypothetical protein
MRWRHPHLLDARAGLPASGCMKTQGQSAQDTECHFCCKEPILQIHPRSARSSRRRATYLIAAQGSLPPTQDARRVTDGALPAASCALRTVDVASLLTFGILVPPPGLAVSRQDLAVRHVVCGWI